MRKMSIHSRVTKIKRKLWLISLILKIERLKSLIRKSQEKAVKGHHWPAIKIILLFFRKKLNSSSILSKDFI